MTEVLIRGGCVLTMDAARGDIVRGDVLVRGDRIVEVGDISEAPGAEIIDAEGGIVLPGLIDGHRHVWQSLLRGIGSNWSFPQYMLEARTLYSGCFDAEAAYITNYLGGLESINAGITSVIDHSHLQISPDISNALARGLKDSGVGGVYCYALQNVPSFLDDGPIDVAEVKDALMREPDAWHDANAARVRDTFFSDGPLRFGVALAETTPYAPSEISKARFDRARALQPCLITGHWNASTHGGVYRSSIADLAEHKAFRCTTLLSHNNDANDDDLRCLARAGVGLCTCPEVETGMGMGRLAARHFIELGGEACLGLDITSFTGADMFLQARMLLQLERKRHADDTHAYPHPLGYQTRAALELLTIAGARAIGQADEIGSLTPGKRADIIVIKPDKWHAAPAADPESILLFHSTPRDIDAVLVAGKILKRDGQLVGIDQPSLADTARAAFARVKTRYGRLPQAELATIWEGMF